MAIKPSATAPGGGGGSGDVVGPASATDFGVALFDTTTGKLLQSPATFYSDADGKVTINEGGDPPASGGTLTVKTNIAGFAIYAEGDQGVVAKGGGDTEACFQTESQAWKVDNLGDQIGNDAEFNDVTAATVSARMAPITATDANITLTEAQSGSFVQLIHTSGAARSITLPTAPADGTWYTLMLYTGAATEQQIVCGGTDSFSQPGGALDAIGTIGNNVESTGFAIVVYSAQIQQWLIIGALGLYPPV